MGKYIFTEIMLTPGDSSTVQIYTQNNTQNDTINLDETINLKGKINVCRTDLQNCI